MLSVSVFFNVTSLPDSIYEYTKDSLEHMVKEGAFPDLIQVGNEIINGMLWPVAKVDPLGMENWDLFVKLLESGAKACREICPKAKIIIHTEKAGEWNKIKTYYNHLWQLDYDIIGLSYYSMRICLGRRDSSVRDGGFRPSARLPTRIRRSPAV